MTSESKLSESAIASLSRIQEFDSSSLVQPSRLGSYAFHSAVEPANRIISLFRLLPLGALDQFPEIELNVIQSLCDATFNIFSEVLEFDTDAGENKQRQSALTNKISDQYLGSSFKCNTQRADSICKCNG
jgi:hypothetical protein